MRKVQFQLETLTCPSCINKIESTLKKTAGVQDPRVLFNSSKVKAQIDESKIEASEVEKIIMKLGYPVLDTKVS